MSAQFAAIAAKDIDSQVRLFWKIYPWSKLFFANFTQQPVVWAVSEVVYFRTWGQVERNSWTTEGVSTAYCVHRHVSVHVVSSPDANQDYREAGGEDGMNHIQAAGFLQKHGMKSVVCYCNCIIYDDAAGTSETKVNNWVWSGYRQRQG